jgi:preprotein translocase subunit YajC
VDQFFPFILLALLAVMLFVLPARQRKRAAAQQQTLQESLTVGTPVMTTSGLHGTVAALHEGTVELEIAPGVVVTIVRPAILEVRRPVGDAGAAGGETPGAAGGRPGDGTL